MVLVGVVTVFHWKRRRDSSSVTLTLTLTNSTMWLGGPSWSVEWICRSC